MKKTILFLFSLFISLGILCAQHLKKDGTPDMRYKENKQAKTQIYTPSSSSYHSYPVPAYQGTHLKKDGTPDLRYKENKKPGTAPGQVTAKGSSKSLTTYPVKRDKNGRIIRSEKAKHEFMRQTGYPNGRPGYVVDHIVPLKKGGCDCPANMQWQTIEAAKAKDKWE